MKYMIYQLIDGRFKFIRDYKPSDYYTFTSEPIKHMETFGRVSVFDPKYSNNSRIIKRQNVLIIDNKNDNTYLNKLLKLFNSNPEYWSTRFMNFNETNYPEFFI